MNCVYIYSTYKYLYIHTQNTTHTCKHTLSVMPLYNTHTHTHTHTIQSPAIAPTHTRLTVLPFCFMTTGQQTCLRHVAKPAFSESPQNSYSTEPFIRVRTSDYTSE